MFAPTLYQSSGRTVRLSVWHRRNGGVSRAPTPTYVSENFYEKSNCFGSCFFSVCNYSDRYHSISAPGLSSVFAGTRLR